MSRIGNRTLLVPNNINIEINSNNIVLKNGTNSLVVNFPSNLIKIDFNDSKIQVNRLDDSIESNMFQGTVNANINNAIIGLSTGFTKVLELKGVGYKAKVEGEKLNLLLGYSHPINLEIPKGLKVESSAPTEIKISGFDKQAVGQFASVIRSYREPEPYKGKGVLYANEVIVRKVGKTADKKK